MAVQGQLLRARHLFPGIVAQWINFRRGLLRLRWGISAIAHLPDLFAQGIEWIGSLVGLSFVGLGDLLHKVGDFFRNFGENLSALWGAIWQFLTLPLRIRYVPTWTTGAAAGTVGVMLTILLFLFPREAQPRPVAPRPAPAWPQPQTPAVAPLVSQWEWPASGNGAQLATRWSLLGLRFPFDQTQRTTVVSTPVRIADPWSPLVHRDLWRRSDRLRSGDVHDFTAYIKRIDTPRAGLPLIPLLSTDTNALAAAGNAARLPSISVEKRSPAFTVAQKPFDYVIVVRNVGSDAVERVIVREQVSTVDRVVMTTPPAAVEATGALQWELARIEPGEARELWVTLLPDRPEVLQSHSTVEIATQIGAVTTIHEPARTDPPPAKPMPEPMFEPPPMTAEPAVFIPEETRPLPVAPQGPQLRLKARASRSVEFGDVWSAVYEITNTGDAPAREIVLTVDIPEALNHRFGKRVEHRIAELAPGQSRTAYFAALAQTPGRATLNALLAADGETGERQTSTIEIHPADESPTGLRSQPPAARGAVRKSSRLTAGLFGCPPRPCLR